MSGNHTQQTDASSRGVALPERLAERAQALASQLSGRFAEAIEEGLLAASTELGLDVFAELMEADATALAGPRGKHDPGRSHVRHGAERGTVTLGGRSVAVTRPRVRTADGRAEAVIESYAVAHATDLLDQHVLTAMLTGVSTRRYQSALEPVGTQAVERSVGASRSSVSRRFIAATTQRLDELLSRPLGEQRWLIVYIDGFRFGAHTLVGALGVSAQGVKVPLAVAEGSAENAALAREVVSDLRERGLDASGGVLFVVDGSKALARAVGDVFGRHAFIQRCRVHKRRNVLERLPARQHEWVGRKLGEAWAQEDAADARRDLLALARRLERDHPGAANALREGLDETLTVTRLGVRGALLRTVASTNPVESMGSIMREHARQVRHWRNGLMALRWAAAGMECARLQFRRVRGYRQLPELAAALQAEVARAEVRLDNHDSVAAA